MRRLWTFALALSLFSVLPLLHAEDEPGFKPLFNGNDLTGWDGNPDFWSVRDGAITGQTTPDKPTNGNTFLIWRDGEVDDFIIRLDYKIVGGNSGIQYRSREFDKWVIGGYQADIDSGTTFSGINYEERGRGILAERGKKVTLKADGGKEESQIGDNNELQKLLKNEDWNSYEIIADGNHLTHKINGIAYSETIDDKADARAMSGLLALQLHAGPPMTIQFKNIRIKRTKLSAVNGLPPRKKLVMVAGTPSHAPGDHEFNAGCLLLKKCLDQSMPNFVTAEYSQGWPKDPTAFDNADGIFLFADGGGGHPAIQGNRLAEIDALVKHGVGVACAHYAVEFPKEKGGPEFLQWIGGYFEANWSVNPHWNMEKDKVELATSHPICRGVQPFSTNDEWYYHMRFPADMKNVTPILSAIPPDETRNGPDGTHSGNPTVRERKGKSEVLAWAVDRPDGGRGFGFTGGHFHRNWADADNRKLVLNALVWITGADVPQDGVNSTISDTDLAANLDKK